MKRQAFNPFLPLNMYIPDGEPHVFGDRVYLFGSHEEERGTAFCTLGYEFFSAPLSDLSNWTSKGINYEAKQDPGYGKTGKYMYAPDVVRGNDGRYYLYYALSGGALFTTPIHVAVCDTPDGKYEYYGEVRNPDGTPFMRKITFDPAVLNDGGKIRLYYGWSLTAGRLPLIGISVKMLKSTVCRPILFRCSPFCSERAKRRSKESRAASWVPSRWSLETICSR